MRKNILKRKRRKYNEEEYIEEQKEERRKYNEEEHIEEEEEDSIIRMRRVLRYM